MADSHFCSRVPDASLKEQESQPIHAADGCVGDNPAEGLVFEMEICSSVQEYLTSENVHKSLGAIKDFANIVFFAVAGTVAVKSYQQAKRTLFAPIRTELFKLRMGCFNDIFSFFHDRTEWGLRMQFDMCRMIEKEVIDLSRRFAAGYRGTTFTEDLREADEAYRQRYGCDYLWLTFRVSRQDTGDSSNKFSDPSSLKEYENFVSITMTDKWHSELDKLQGLEKPILPENIQHKLGFFRTSVTYNYVLMTRALESWFASLPGLYPTPAQFCQNFDFAAVCKDIIKSLPALRPEADEIIDAINQYIHSLESKA